MSDWNSFLLSQGALINAQGDADFMTGAFDPETTYVIPLSRQGILSIKGPDASKFLQGQVTCDVKELEENQTRLGAQCNIKGRMLLCFRALQKDPEQIFLRINKGLVTNGLSSLGKYIVFSKAKLTDATQEFRYLGVAGPNAGEVIKEVFGVEISGNDKWSASHNNLIIRINERRYECWTDINEAENLWKKLVKKASPASENNWTLLNIQEGIGDITPDTFEAFTPQTINFQLVNGINFRKGCYTGQEIVARLHYRGTLKRHMYRFGFSLQNAELPKPGSELKNADGKSIGEVILSAKKNSTYGELLASVVDDERAEIYLGTNIDGNMQKLELLPLPYAIPTSNGVD